MARNSRKLPSPSIHRQRTLRVLGTDISLLEAVQFKAISDLGFNIEFEVLDFPNCQRKAALNPEAYDVYDQCFHNLAIVWFWGALQPIDTTWLSNWSKVSALTKSGGVGKYANRGFGDAPMHKLYVQPDHSLGPEETRYIAMLPTVHNFDSSVMTCGFSIPTAMSARVGLCCSTREHEESLRLLTSPRSAFSMRRWRQKPWGSCGSKTLAT